MINAADSSVVLKYIFFTVIAAVFSSAASPVIITGKQLPKLLGKPVNSLRVLDLKGNAVPFQIDQVTPSGEYVLSDGDRPNTHEARMEFGEKDEVVFLWDDADLYSDNHPPQKYSGEFAVLSRGENKRAVIILSDNSIPLSKKRYIEYDHSKQRITTPYYYADFGRDRFHFVKAGIMDPQTNKYVGLTNELRVEILLRAAWGLIPVRYSEDNIVCLVRRYKAGPIRLIRMGDFYLDLGMGMKGSKAAVNQICYPQLVEVPVNINLPVRFRTFFSQAYIEMTPVLREEASSFKFSAADRSFTFPIAGDKIDTLHSAIVNDKFFTVSNNSLGYGWLLSTNMNPAHLAGSGFVMRRPSNRRGGIAECGFRLAVRDVPKGSYRINNKVFFSPGLDDRSRIFVKVL
ncbi:MAG: hypothetical protein FWE57_09850 [Chitinispirillia bacterium]|nr:hypothetical protein [Chitinispirillia bacterium]